MYRKTGKKFVLDSCISRRAFLVGSGAAVASTVFLTSIPGMEGRAVAARVTRYPRKMIGKLSALRTGKPKEFNYPDDGKNTKNTSKSILIRLGAPAGGGIGKNADVVAYNSLCTHMGGGLARTYKRADYAVGPCPLHQSTFDLTRHGMIIGGHATESLPQVLLELEGDDIYAVGMIGLIYGRYDNLKG
jgi:arsenite oxidase small subunit